MTHPVRARLPQLLRERGVVGLDLIGRLQAAMAVAGLRKGQTVAFLSANSAETWCAGVAPSA